MESYERDDRFEKEEIFSKAVRAGKRTYFFDVRATRRDEYYLTITESKKRMERDGKFFYEKHKVFLYQEDFDKFTLGLQEIVDYIKSTQMESSETGINRENEIDAPEYSSAEFGGLSQ
ncbi:MAG: DUF3276 family protein [Breznakibacter sp.]